MVKNFGGFGIPLGKYKIKRKLYIYQFEIKNLIILFNNKEDLKWKLKVLKEFQIILESKLRY